MNLTTTSSATRLETLPLTWDAQRDETFFRIVADVFDARYCLGASMLLASNDLD